MAEVVTYADIPILKPSHSDKVVGIVRTDGKCYCRVCVDRLGLGYTNMKYITRSNAHVNQYNCIECGWRITKNRMDKY
jgi:hypothetical protein